MKLAAAWLAIATAALVSGCVSTGRTLPPRAAGEPAAQVIHPAGGESAASCNGGETFPVAALDGPDVSALPGPEFEALRREIALFPPNDLEFPVVEKWRLVSRRADALLFVGDSDRGLFYLLLEPRDGRWQASGFGDCGLHLVIAPDVGAAEWWLDPRRQPPTQDSTVLEILVMEQACASGSYASGRISSPVVLAAHDTITITMGVRRVGGAAWCPANPATPAVLILSEPVGERQLLDGFHVPPQPPAPPE